MDNVAAADRIRVLPRPAWPAPVTLRRLLWVARARPWNTAHSDASLRLLRGGAPFLRDCATTLEGLGAPSVISPPLPAEAQSRWRRAGFEPYLELALMRLDLGTTPEPATHHVEVSDDIDAAAAVDAAAFDEFWALDRWGLEEAMEAGRASELLVVGRPMRGFAIVGYGTMFSYLQRVAVHPDHQGTGVGTSLIGVAADRGRRRGTRVMFLNTQLDNEGSLRLYRKLGFERMNDGLLLLRRPRVR